MAASRRPGSSRSRSSDSSEGAGNQSTRIKPYERSGQGGEDEEYVSSDEGYGEEGYADGGYGEDEAPFESTDSLPPLEDEEENPDATRAGPPLTLEIVEGPDRGRRRRFKSVRMVIGRGQGCDVVLSDQSVSRRHVELVYGEGGVMLRDLGSGNGTKVNDENADERVLVHGDVIAIGRTRLRFVDEQERVKQMRAQAEEEERKAKEEAERKAQQEAAAAAGATGAAAGEAAAAGEGGGEAGSEGGQQAQEGEPGAEGQDPQAAVGTEIRSVDSIPPRRKKKQRPLPFIIAGVMVLLLALIGGGIALMRRGPPPAPQEDPREVRAMDLVQEARAAFRRGDYAEAVRLAEEADALFAGSAGDFLEMARKELSIVQAFQQVRQLMDEGRFDEARALLQKTPRGSSQTDGERARLEAELGTREAEYLVKALEQALEARDVETARALIRRLPIERQPLYLSRLEEVEASMAAEELDAEAEARARRAAAAKRAKQEREEFIQGAFRVVEMRFNAGDYARAALECDRVIDAHRGDKQIIDRAKELKRLIPQFARLYQDAQRKVQANALESAARPLRSAATLYRQIAFQGSVGETINGQLAVASVVAGRAALARNDLSAAASYLQEALRLRPDDERAQESLASIQDKLEDIYEQAYRLRDRDPEGAAEKFRLVQQLAAEGSELKLKAEEQLQAPEQP
jgi:pSer/pThr/pTyr-binding forkhead associated (FHA) protein